MARWSKQHINCCIVARAFGDRHVATFCTDFHMSMITINGIAIDPTAPKPMLAAFGLDNASAKKSDYLVVQTKKPLNQDERATLEKAGAKILESVPGNAYVCYFPKTSLAKLRSLKFVNWAELFPQAVKIAPSLRDLRAIPGGVTLAAAAAAAPGVLDDTMKEIDVVLHRNASAKKVAKEVAQAAHVDVKDVQIAGQKIRLRTKLRRLEDIGQVDGVRHRRSGKASVHNTVARQVLRILRRQYRVTTAGHWSPADTGFTRVPTNTHPALLGVSKLYDGAQEKG